MNNFIQFINSGVVGICQLLAIVVIFIGLIKAIIVYVKDALMGADTAKAIHQSRLELGHSFSLGLGFLIGASILKTTLAPTWTDIGQLSAIIAIRTLLNYFLLMEIGKFSGKKEEPSPKKISPE
ncbi:DUF1622 domain-containing protein [Candidatus Sumerlaeota bacterium]|nr:DUF1622 domain-containing protein [Candidatus Sumerlaeota bacterium]